MTGCTSRNAYKTCKFVVGNLTVCEIRIVVKVFRQRLGTLRYGATATMWIVRTLRSKRAADSVMVVGVGLGLSSVCGRCVCLNASSMAGSSKQGVQLFAYCVKYHPEDQDTERFYTILKNLKNSGNPRVNYG
jgi:hypothetical protein